MRVDRFDYEPTRHRISIEDQQIFIGGGSMYYKKPYLEHFELVAVTRVHVLQKRPNGDFETQFELANGTILDRVYTPTEYAVLMTNPPPVIV